MGRGRGKKIQTAIPDIERAIEIVPIYSANDFSELLVKFGILKIAKPRSVSLGLCSIQAGSNDPFCAFATGYFLRYTVGRMAEQDVCSKALRVIGQMLDKQRIDLFELKCFGDEFYLQCGDPLPPHLNLIEMRYSVTEIRALDSEAKAKRRESFKLVNFEGLPEILRALGRRVDESHARLLRVSNSDSVIPFDSIKIEYQTRDGQRHAEEFLAGAIGDQALRMYKERSRRLDSNSWR